MRLVELEHRAAFRRAAQFIVIWTEGAEKRQIARLSGDWDGTRICVAVSALVSRVLSEQAVAFLLSGLETADSEPSRSLIGRDIEYRMGVLPPASPRASRWTGHLTLLEAWRPRLQRTGVRRQRVPGLPFRHSPVLDRGCRRNALAARRVPYREVQAPWTGARTVWSPSERVPVPVQSVSETAHEHRVLAFSLGSPSALK